MRHLFLISALLLSSLVMAQKEPVKVGKGFQVEIQTSAVCEMCQHAIEYDLTFAKGVKSAALSLEDKVVTVVYNPDKIDAAEIRERITKVGYHADSLARDSGAYDKLPFCCKDGSHGTPIPQLPTKNN